MNSTATKQNQLKQIVKRLIFVAVINIALMLVWFGLAVVAYFVAGSFSAESDHDEETLHTLFWLLPLMKYLSIACLGLLLLWGPALVVFLFRLKQMRKECDA
jgi:hypothetical protein